MYIKLSYLFCKRKQGQGLLYRGTTVQAWEQNRLDDSAFFTVLSVIVLIKQHW